MHTQRDPTGPTLLWMWGEISKSFGRLEALTLGNREMVLDQVRALHMRQDDMRRELLTHLERSQLMSKPRRSAGWLRYLPWERLAVFVVTTLGALGWIRPSWVKTILGLP